MHLQQLEELQTILNGFEVVDLAHTIERGMPRWPSHPPIVIDPCCTHEHDGFYNQCLIMGEHSGSHVDAPAHTVPEQKERTIDVFPADAICGQAVVYDLRKLGLGAGDRVCATQIREIESEMGDAVQTGEIAIINFGWEQYWRTDRNWVYYAKNEPGMAEDAVKLFAQRRVKAMAFDNISSDMPLRDGVEFPSTGHYQHWLPNEILMIEELKNLDRLPTRCFFVAIPLKIKNGSGSPIRPFALVPKKETK